MWWTATEDGGRQSGVDGRVEMRFIDVQRSLGTGIEAELGLEVWRSGGL